MLLVLGAGLVLAAALLLEPRHWQRWRRQAVAVGDAEPRRRRLLLDYYALVGTFILTTAYLPIVLHLPSTWANLAPVPYMQLVLLGAPALAWFGVCMACRWGLRSGSSPRGRTIWWLSLGLSALAWLPCNHCHVAGL